MHGWELSPKEAIEVQKRLAGAVREEPLRRTARLVAGCDVSFNRFENIAYAAIVVLDYKSLEVVESVNGAFEANFPYIPGLLSFRETPPLIKLFERVKSKVDLIVVDGQGVAHPRRFGIASHIGVLMELPTIGCAKNLLIGEYRQPGNERGSWVELMDGGERIGAVLRTRKGVKPVFVSVGHKITLKDSIEAILRLTPRFRIAAPIRAAHGESNLLRKMKGKEGS
ncbi:MAG: deoxyribonuclease V [Myxococcota bacterium]